MRRRETAAIDKLLFDGARREVWNGLSGPDRSIDNALGLLARAPVCILNWRTERDHSSRTVALTCTRQKQQKRDN